MLKQLVHSPNQTPSLFQFPSSSSSSSSSPCLSQTLIKSMLSNHRRCSISRSARIRRSASEAVKVEDKQAEVEAEAVEARQEELTATQCQTTTVRAVVTVKKGVFSHMGLARGLDDIGDLLGKSLLLELKRERRRRP